jgi:hypothetical protein
MELLRAKHSAELTAVCSVASMLCRACATPCEALCAQARASHDAAVHRLKQEHAEHLDRARTMTTNLAAAAKRSIVRAAVSPTVLSPSTRTARAAFGIAEGARPSATSPQSLHERYLHHSDAIHDAATPASSAPLQQQGALVLACAAALRQ